MSNIPLFPNKLFETITSNAEYVDSPSAFFSNFSPSWERVSSQVLKYENLQDYDETGNPAYDAFIAGNITNARALALTAKKDDFDIYGQVRAKGIDFVRCRPVRLPLSEYMKWSLYILPFNVRLGERIFCFDETSCSDLIRSTSARDFMVFDQDIAFVHNYEVNRLVGGWSVTDKRDIHLLSAFFVYLKSFSTSLEIFTQENILPDALRN